MGVRGLAVLGTHMRRGAWLSKRLTCYDGAVWGVYSFLGRAVQTNQQTSTLTGRQRRRCQCDKQALRRTHKPTDSTDLISVTFEGVM